MSEKLTKRFKALGWRLGGAIVVTTLAFLLEPDTIVALQESGVAVPVSLIGVGSLILGEVTKYFNSKK